MAKAILVIDMPKNCGECALNNLIFGCHFGYELKDCPLKPMPEKKVPVFDPNNCDMKEEIKIIHEIEGYNICISEILGAE